MEKKVLYFFVFSIVFAVVSTIYAFSTLDYGAAYTGFNQFLNGGF